MTPFEYQQLWSQDADRVFDALVDARLLREITLGTGAHEARVHVDRGDGTLDVTVESVQHTPDGVGDERSVRTVRWSADRRNATWTHVTVGYEDQIHAAGSLHLVEDGLHRTRVVTRGTLEVQAGPMSPRLESRLVAVFRNQAEREGRLLQRQLERASATV